MKTSTFEEISTLVYQQSGIDLPPGKAPLVSGRLGKRMRALGLADEQAYLRYVLDDNSGEELVQLLDAISTNFTQFFREQDHFELLANEFRKRLKSGASPQFRIWSAACSSGEEPYSIAMTVDDVARSMGANLDQFKILATDISTRVLARAIAGQYHNREMNHVPASLRERYFARAGVGDARTFTTNASLQRYITFRRLNLSRPPFPMQGPFELIFCRNVMIYFDQDVRSRLLHEIERLLAPGGTLLVGHTESLAGISTRLKMITPSVYKKEALP